MQKESSLKYHLKLSDFSETKKIKMLRIYQD